MRPSFDAVPDGAAQLEELLTRSGADFRREGGRFSLTLSSRGCKWRAFCDAAEGRVLVYSIHPARVADRASALELCSRLNAQVVEGGFFLSDGHIVFRTSARLGELWQAQELIAHAIEYNAAVVAAFWQRVAAGAAGQALDF